MDDKRKCGGASPVGVPLAARAGRDSSGEGWPWRGLAWAVQLGAGAFVLLAACCEQTYSGAAVGSLRAALLGGLCVAVVAVGAAPAWATSIAVTTSADSVANDGACSLREAVLNSNDDSQNGRVAAGE